MSTPSATFLRLRQDFHEALSAEMAATVRSLQRVDRSLARLNQSRPEFASTKRIWQGFYDPLLTEKMYSKEGGES